MGALDHGRGLRRSGGALLAVAWPLESQVDMGLGLIPTVRFGGLAAWVGFTLLSAVFLVSAASFLSVHSSRIDGGFAVLPMKVFWVGSRYP